MIFALLSITRIVLLDFLTAGFYLPIIFKDKMIPFSYKSGVSFLHRMNAGIKLLCLLAISTAAFFNSAAVSAALCVMILLCAIIAGVRLRSLLSGSGAVFIMTAFVVVFRSIRFFPPSFNAHELFAAVFFGWSMIISFCAGSLLFSVTTMTELKDAVSLGGRFVKLSIALSLMLSFIPRFFEIWDEMRTANYARGGKKGLTELILLVPLVVERMIEMAAETAIALEARGL